MLFDKSLVRSNQAAGRHIPIIDFHLKAFSQKRLDYFYKRTFSKIIRIGLECHSKKSHSFLAQPDNPLDDTLNVNCVALKNGI